LRGLYFALSQDGKACAFSMCLSNCNKSEERPVTTLSLCQHISQSGPCEIYAYRGHVVSNSGVKPGG
jgi:hypothetical protein